MKIGVFGDLHLGNRQYGLSEREQDFYSQYLKAIDVFIEKKVDIVVCAGDVFDQARPSPKTLEVFSEGLKRLSEKNIEFYNIVGNHSMVQSKGFVTPDDFLKTFRSNDYKYFLLNKDFYFKNEEVFICGLPYYHNFQLDDLIEDVSFLNKQAKKEKGKKILVLHQAFREYCGFTGEKLSINDIDISNFDIVICGHIHDTKITDINSDTVFLQPGSLERSSVAEARDEENQGKGVFVIDTQDFSLNSIANGFIRLKSLRKFLIADMYIKIEEEVEDIRKEILDEIKDCFLPPVLFLTVHDTSESFRRLMDLTKELKNDCLTVNFNYFDESKKDDFNIVGESGEIPSPREALKIALNPLDEDEARLGLDLYDNLKDNKDVSGILKEFEEKLKKKNEGKYKEIELEPFEDLDI